MLIAPGAEADVAAALGIDDGVAQDMLEAFAKPPRIADDNSGRGLDRDIDGLAIVGDARLDRFDRGAAQPGQVDPLGLDRDPAGVALGQVEDVVDELRQSLDRLEDRGDIVRCGRRQLAGIARRQHLGEPTDRGQRGAQFIAHVGDEIGLDPVGLLERGRPFAQGFLDAGRIGDVDHGEEGVAVGQRDGGHFEVAAVGEADPAPALSPPRGRRADEFADRRGKRRVGQLLGQRGDEVVDPGMFAKPGLVELPQRAEAAVPQVKAAITGEHADRLEQIVEGRRTNAEQRVAGRGEADLFGAIFEDQAQSAVGQGLADDAQMVAVGEDPVLLDHLVGRGEPAAAFLLPLREIADFGGAVLLAHPFEQAVEFGGVAKPVGVDLGHDREGLVEKAQVAIGVELSGAGGHPVGKVAL